MGDLKTSLHCCLGLFPYFGKLRVKIQVPIVMNRMPHEGSFSCLLDTDYSLSLSLTRAQTHNQMHDTIWLSLQNVNTIDFVISLYLLWPFRFPQREPVSPPSIPAGHASFTKNQIFSSYTEIKFFENFTSYNVLFYDWTLLI